jgi:hypothetical protein
MIAVAVVAVVTTGGMYLGPELARDVGILALADVVLALLIGGVQQFSTRGTLVIAATAVFWTLQYVWWGNFGTVNLAVMVFCLSALPFWYLPPGGSTRLLVCQMMWGVVAMIAAMVVMFALSLIFVRL